MNNKSIKTFRFKENAHFTYQDFMLDLSGMIDVSFRDLIRKDARLLGELIETALELTFSDLSRVGGNLAYDLINDQGDRKIEVRVLGKNSKITFQPSSKAARRKAVTDKSVIFEKARQVTDWLFVESENFPVVKAHIIEGAKVINWLKENMNKSNQYSQKILTQLKLHMAI